MDELMLPSKQQVEELNNKLNQVLNHLPINEGFDPSQYKHLFLQNTASNLPTTFQEIIKVEGEGFITLATLRLSSGNHQDLQIEIDGEIVFGGRSVSTNWNTVGIATIDHLHHNNGTLGPPDYSNRMIQHVTNMNRPFPSSPTTIATFAALNHPAFFKESFRILAAGTGTSSASSIIVMGGIK